MSLSINRTPTYPSVGTPRKSLQKEQDPAELTDNEKTEEPPKAITTLPKAFKPYLKNEKFNPWSLIPAVAGGVTLSISSLIPNLGILLALFGAGFGLEVLMEKMRQSEAKEANETFKQALDNLKNETKNRPPNTPLSQQELQAFEPQQQTEQMQWVNNVIAPPLVMGAFASFLGIFAARKLPDEKRVLPILLLTASVATLTAGVATLLEKDRQTHAKQENQAFKKKLQDFIAYTN